MTDGALIMQHSSGRTLNSHLVLNAATDHVIALPQSTVAIDLDFRHQEQRYSREALAFPFNLCQHQMDDIIRHVMIATSDKDFSAGDGIGTVVLLHRLGAHQF